MPIIDNASASESGSERSRRACAVRSTKWHRVLEGSGKAKYLASTDPAVMRGLVVEELSALKQIILFKRRNLPGRLSLSLSRLLLQERGLPHQHVSLFCLRKSAITSGRSCGADIHPDEAHKTKRCCQNTKFQLRDHRLSWHPLAYAMLGEVHSTKDCIKEDEFIHEYVGEVISQEEAERRGGSMTRQIEATSSI